ncbi:hypothetical protein HDA43_001665 [Streptosporangium sandarakinum]|uniref:Uncharacterized protein n=1 Tax=Streptosporangium sandarakinum TaxID=1260955 RepID=A0A852UVB2_9ACTN|nr:hypothetical protein [Streptosporangium sandarakinum]
MTVSPQDAFFIEHPRREKGARSRSAVIREAPRPPREAPLGEERAAAFPNVSLRSARRAVPRRVGNGPHPYPPKPGRERRVGP